MPPKDKYTDPELRDQVKEEVKESDKGGAPGQWSARKAQMMAKEYKNRGGDYNQDKDQKDESQQNLTDWGEEDWQTKEGSGNAKKDDGTQKRYLPKKAWEQMSEKEKQETDQKKQEESKEGKQHVENTEKAKDSRKNASESSGGEQTTGTKAGGKQSNGKKNDTQKEDTNPADDGDDEYDVEADRDQDGENEQDHEDGGEGEDHQDGEDEGDEEDKNEEERQGEDKDQPGAKAGQKRKGKQANGSSKKQKADSGDGKSNGTVGSKHMDATEPGKQGSKDRLPKTGQQIHWKAMPGWVDGAVTEILKQDGTVDGKTVKASDDDPKIVLKSNKSGKICIHKPEACYYD